MLIPDCITWKIGPIFNYSLTNDNIGTLDDAQHFSNDYLFLNLLSLCDNEISFTDVCCIKSTDRINLAIPLTFRYGDKLYKIHPKMPMGKYGTPIIVDGVDRRFIVVNIIDGVSGIELEDEVALYVHNNYLNISLANNRYTIETVANENNTVCTLTVLFEKFNILVEEISTVNNNKCKCPGDLLIPQNDLCSKAYWHIIEGQVNLNFSNS